MKPSSNKAMRVLAGLAGAAAALGVQAHPGVHHLNGVGHSPGGGDELILAAVAVWALVMGALGAGLYLKRRRGRD